MSGRRSCPPKSDPIDIASLRPPFAPRNGAAAWLFRLHRLGIRPGLESVTELLAHLGNPQRDVPSIVVAGTNGKGSTAHALTALLESTGLRVGLYTSPHLLDLRERILVDGEMIPTEDLFSLVAEHRGAIERLGTTFFESLTGLALEYFRRRRVDVAVLEAGLGGRLDATNAVDKRGVLLTSVGLDHQELLGSTVEAIAQEKLGLAAADIPLYVFPLEARLEMLARGRADEVGAELVLVADEEVESMPSCLTSERARRNWVRSVICARDLCRREGWAAPDLEGAARRLRMPCRYDPWGTRPPLHLDTAHNAHALLPLLEDWGREGDRSARVLVLGVMADKNLDGVVDAAVAAAGTIVTVAPRWPRALPPLELKARLTGRGGPSVEVRAASSVREGLEWARELAASVEGGSVLATGSNFLVAEVLDRLGVDELHRRPVRGLWDEGLPLRRRELVAGGMR